MDIRLIPYKRRFYEKEKKLVFGLLYFAINLYGGGY